MIRNMHYDRKEVYTLQYRFYLYWGHEVYKISMKYTTHRSQSGPKNSKIVIIFEHGDMGLGML